MDIRVIRYFIKAVQLGSINKAAQVFYMNHQNLGKKLSDLENELGVELLVRSKTGISLTENGEFLYDKFLELDELLSEIEVYAQTVTSIEKQKQQNEVNLLIILSNSIFPKKISKALLDMENRFPESHISVMEASLEKAVKKIYETENAFANIVLPMNNPYAIPDDITVWKEKKHRLVVYAPKDILQDEKSLDVRQILSLPIVLYSSTGNIEDNTIYETLLQYGQPIIHGSFINFPVFYKEKKMTSSKKA